MKKKVGETGGVAPKCPRAPETPRNHCDLRNCCTWPPVPPLLQNFYEGSVDFAISHKDTVKISKRNTMRID